jgi:hypothetical protein
MVRNYINRGPHMAKSNAAFDHVSYIRFERINNFIMVFMKNLKDEIRL